MQQIAKFPFVKIGKGPLGELYRPYAPVLLFSEKKRRWLLARMVVDSGADYTLLPRRYAVALGIDTARDCVAETTLGVGGSETVYLCKSLEVKIGNYQKKIPVGFLERDDIPALLGRLKMIEDLRVVFDNFATTFEKSKN